MKNKGDSRSLMETIRYYDELLVSFYFAILLGFVNGIMDTMAFGGTYFQNMFLPNAFQIFERFLFIVFALSFGYFWHNANVERKTYCSMLEELEK